MITESNTNLFLWFFGIFDLLFISNRLIVTPHLFQFCFGLVLWVEVCFIVAVEC